MKKTEREGKSNVETEIKGYSKKKRENNGKNKNVFCILEYNFNFGL